MSIEVSEHEQETPGRMEPVAMRMSDDLVYAIEAEAQVQDRTFSDMARLILRDEMVRRGRLCPTCYAYQCAKLGHAAPPAPTTSKPTRRSPRKSDAVS